LAADPEGAGTLAEVAKDSLPSFSNGPR